MRTITTRGVDDLGNLVEQEVLTGKQSGQLAIHVDWKGDLWCITHVPTGLAVCKTPELDVAEEVLEALKAHHWDFDEPKKMPIETRVAAVTYLNRMIKLHEGFWANVP